MFRIPILYEDNHLLVVQKPPNILSQGDKTGDPDLLTLLKQNLKLRYNKPGNVYLGLVHRLDRPVGGVMMLAKTSKSAARLSEQIRTKELIRTYLAIIHGRPEKTQGTLIHYLLKDCKTNMVSAVNPNVKGAQEAILDYEVIGNRGRLSLVKVNLRTGRPHQIRAQFASSGHPVYGDQRYGRSVTDPKQQIALWSHQITCLHPITKERMVFHSVPENHPWNQFKQMISATL